MLAVGIEAGAREELSRITLNANRVLVANTFNQISKSDGSIFESIQVMVANPPGYGGEFIYYLLSTVVYEEIQDYF